MGIILVVAILLFAANRSEAPSEPVQPVNSTNGLVPEVPKDINIEDPAVDVEGDAADLDVNEEVLEDFDSEDFDDEAIDNEAF